MSDQESYGILLYTCGMVKRLRLKEHLKVDAIAQRYRGAGDPVARSQWQILWLLARGDGGGGRGDRLLRDLDLPDRAALQRRGGGGDRRPAAWQSRRGPAARRRRAGRPARGARRSRPGRWPVERPADRGLAGGAAWTYLRRLGQTPQVPRPSHAQADPAAQEAFKKGASRRP